MMTTDDGAMRLSLSCFGDIQQTDPFRSVTCVPQQETLRINDQLARLFLRGLSLVEAKTGQVRDYVSGCWQRVVVCHRNHSRATNRPFAVSQVQPSPTLIDLLGRNKTSPAENQQSACGAFSPFDAIEYVCIGVLPVNADPEPWFSATKTAFHTSKYVEKSAVVPSLAAKMMVCVERSFSDWNAAFRNISRQFAQLNWTSPFNTRVADRATESSTLAPKAIER